MRDRLLAVVAVTPCLLLAGAAQAALVISNAPTQNVSCVAATCTATAAHAVLNATDLLVNLKRHNTTIVSGGSAMDIVFDTQMHWTAPTRLILDAYRSVTVTQPVISQGHGGMAVTVNDGGSGGDLLFADKGRLAFWDTSSSLQINGQPYVLVSDLATLAADVAAHPGGRYAFADNYDAFADGTYSQSPVNTRLVGTFEGLGNTISHLRIDGCCGMFIGVGTSRFSSTVRDIVLAGEIIHAPFESSGARSVGGLAGDSYGSIIGVSSIGGLVTADTGAGHRRAVGGLVGSDSMANQIVRSHASGQVFCKDVCYAGGLIGELIGSVTRSSASGSVTARTNSFAGGLIGRVVGASVSLSFATGAASVGNSRGNSGVDAAGAGGLTGWSAYYGNIDRCYATGAASGGSPTTRMDAVYVGGLVGKGEIGVIKHSYATGSASVGAGGRVGGFAGDGYSTGMTQNYSTGLVSGEPGLAGGFIGQDLHPDSAPGYNCWDLDTSGISDPGQGAGNLADDPAVTGLTTAQFQSGLPGGFDPVVWGENPGINNGLPYLLAIPPQ